MSGENKDILDDGINIDSTTLQSRVNDLTERAGELKYQGGFTVKGVDFEGIQNLIEVLSDSGISYQQKLDAAVKMQGQTLPIMLAEMQELSPNKDRSIIANRFAQALKNIVTMLQSIEEQKNKEKVDLRHPKIQTAFTWIIETMVQVLNEEELPSLTIKAICMNMQAKLVGWEERANKELDGISVKALASVGNPFTYAIEKAQFDSELEEEETLSDIGTEE